MSRRLCLSSDCGAVRERSRPRPAVLRLLLAAAAVAVLAGCGRQADQAQTASAWATSYCTALNNWLTSVDAISRGFDQPQQQSTTLYITDLEEITSQVSLATSTLTDSLSRAGRPETGGAARVEATIARLSAAVTGRSDAANRAAKSDSQAALSGFRRLQAVTAQIDGALDDMLAADTTIRRQDAELRRALVSTTACTDFHDDVKNGTHHGND